MRKEIFKLYCWLPPTYRYDRRSRLLRVYDGKKKLHRTYRVAFISMNCLVLELIQ